MGQAKPEHKQSYLFCDKKEIEGTDAELILEKVSECPVLSKHIDGFVVFDEYSAGSLNIDGEIQYERKVKLMVFKTLEAAIEKVDRLKLTDPGLVGIALYVHKMTDNDVHNSAEYCALAYPN